MKRLKAWAGVLLIFFFGMIVGAVLTSGVIYERYRRLIEGGPDAVVNAVVVRLRRELKLSDDQRQMLQQIVLETRVKLAGIHQQTQPQVRQTLAEAEQKVRGILEPSQIPKFDEIIHRGHEKWDTGLPTPVPVTPASTPAPVSTP